MTTNDILLFPPHDGVDMFQEYPELASLEEFVGLSEEDLRFVWYASNVTSPIYKRYYSNRKKLIEKSMVEAYGKNIRTKESIKFASFMNFSFPAKIRIAMDKMQSFRVTARIKAQDAIDKSFDNILSIAKDAPSNESTISDRKAYTSTVAEISKILPIILKQVEEGFGIRRSEVGSGRDDTLMDELLESE